MRGEPATSDEQATRVPIYVDLDGTLIATDVLWESICLLTRQHPVRALQLPLWLLSGKAHLKQRIAAYVAPAAELLPYRGELVELLRQAREDGRRVVLTTASDSQVAAAIAEHLGCFDRVIGSDGTTNLAGEAKRAAIERDAEGAPFEYVGNSAADIPIWKHAASAVLVAAPRGVARAAERLEIPTRTMPGAASSWRSVLRALRPHQWLKNALLFVPLLLAHEFTDLQRLLQVLFAFASFCAVTSATYLVNDLSDIEADRRHPTKRRRPFAAGTLSIPAGVGISVALLCTGFALSAWLCTPMSTAMLALYLLLTISYSLYLKERMGLDVLVLAGLFTHRVLAGAVAAEVRVSPWLLAFSMFFFLSLALLKRYVELRSAGERGVSKLDRRNYEAEDVGLVESMGLTSGYLSVLVLCLFVSSDDVRLLYNTPELLWAICLVMLYWIMRMWLLARRGHVPDDPVLFAAGDRVSYACGISLAIVVALASL